MAATTAPTVTALTCCDGTGWTGNPRERCVEHFEPLDAIWYGH